MKRRFLLLGWLILQAGLSATLFGQQAVTVIDNGDPANRVDLAILGDGYTANEMDKFATDVQRMLQGLFAQEPWQEYQHYVNVHRIDVASVESGASHPELTPAVMKQTAFDAAFNCGGVQRTVCVNGSKVITAASAALPPSMRDILLVLVNDPQYGGSGGSIVVATLHADVVELVLHEIGHGFGLLADEYGASAGLTCQPNIEPSQPNVTRQTVRDLIKWGSWIDPTTMVPTLGTIEGLPGLYQGAKYCDTGLYRPTYNSKMRSLFMPYEQVNTEQLVKRYYSFVTPWDSSFPTVMDLTVARGNRQTFFLTTPSPLSQGLRVEWRIDGQPQSQSRIFRMESGALAAGMHTIAASVIDPTPFVRNDPNQLLQGRFSWNVHITDCHYSISAPAAYLDAAGGSGGFSVTTGTGCIWSATSSANWLAISHGFGADGNGTVSFSALPNPYPTPRKEVMYVGDQRYTVFQLGTATAESDTKYSIKDLGSITVGTAGATEAVTRGYARVQPDALNPAPAGVAIFSLTQDGILITEAGIPAAPLLRSARIAARIAGPSKTGLAIANPNSERVDITFYFTDPAGVDINAGSFPLPAGAQIAVFLDQSPFQAGPGTDGTLTLYSTLPVAAVALQGLNNERNDFLISTLPVSALGAPLAGAVILPQFADGGGWSSRIVLVNPTDQNLTGALLFRDSGTETNAAEPAAVTIDGITDSSFAYSLPPRSSRTWITSGSAADTKRGSVTIFPDSGSPTPSASGVFLFRSGDVTVTEAGLEAAAPGPAFRVYAEAAGTFGDVGAIQTGIAISNPSATAINVHLELARLDGPATSWTANQSVPAHGQIALFLNQIPGFEAMPSNFRGVLRVSTTSSSGICAVGLRGRYNERGDFLIATVPSINEALPTSGDEAVFPQMVDGGGYTTQFVLFSGTPGQASAGSLRFFSYAGTPLSLILR